MSDEEPKTTTAVEEKTTGDKRKAEDAEEVPVADESTKKYVPLLLFLGITSS